MPFPSCAALLGALGQILLHGLQVKVKPENPADVITSFCCLSCATRLGFGALGLVPGALKVFSCLGVEAIAIFFLLSKHLGKNPLILIEPQNCGVGRNF